MQRSHRLAKLLRFQRDCQTKLMPPTCLLVWVALASQSTASKTIQPDSLYSIAVNIISCFCSFQDLAPKPEILERIPLLAHLLTTTS
jgi:hypothetical protein